MFRRILCLLFSVLLLLSMIVGCANDNSGISTENTSDPTTVSATQEIQATTEADPQPTVTDPSAEESTEPETVPESEADPEAENLPEATAAFKLSCNSLVLTQKGQIVELYNGTIPKNEISWLSADESVALFSQGSVVAINPGTTVVYAKYLDQIIFCEIICDVNPDGPAVYIPAELHHAPRLAPPVTNMEDTSFFDDAAFIGDSVSYVLQQWHLSNGAFGNAIFMARSNLGLQNTIDGRMKVFYQGVQYSPEDGLAAAGVNKVFVMLGTNDIALYGVEGTIERWDTFTSRILEKCPDIEIYIQSCTPVHDDGDNKGINNTLLDNYNAAIEVFCEEKGFHFVNIAPYFKDYTNGMANVYSSDRFVHITNDGAYTWECALKAYAAEQLQAASEQEGE